MSHFKLFYLAFTPLPPPRKQWYDKLADALLGEDDPNIASPSSRYALICEKCFMHNGLVKESMWPDARKFTRPSCASLGASSLMLCPMQNTSAQSAVTSMLLRAQRRNTLVKAYLRHHRLTPRHLILSIHHQPVVHGPPLRRR
jgi:hypothetical protein